MTKKKTVVYQVSVVGKPGHGGRRFKEEEAIELRDLLLKIYPKVKIIKSWV